MEDVKSPDIDPKKAFIVDALDKEIRLSFSKRIKGTLPEPYQALISEEKEKDSPDFKYNDAATPFATQGQEIAQLIRKKAANEEFGPPLENIEQEAANAGLQEPLLASIDAFVTSICWVGSKSMSHVLACIERLKERLLALGSHGPNARKQIITSVMEYWQYQQGVGGVILDKLLNYQILTPTDVIEWVLIDHAQKGLLLVRAWSYEIINITTRKVAERVRSIVRAIRQPGLVDEQKAPLQEALAQEQKSMKALFEIIESALTAIRSSTHGLGSDEEGLIVLWAHRWSKVFRRRYAVEESWVKEELAKPIPIVEQPPPAAVEDEAMKGVPGAANGDGDNGVEVQNDDGIE